MYCIKCGKKIEADWKKCPYCGVDITNILPEKKMDVEEEKVVVCQHCGNQMNSKMRFCTKCGMRIDDNEKNVIKTETQQSYKNENAENETEIKVDANREVSNKEKRIGLSKVWSTIKIIVTIGICGIFAIGLISVYRTEGLDGLRQLLVDDSGRHDTDIDADDIIMPLSNADMPIRIENLKNIVQGDGYYTNADFSFTIVNNTGKDIKTARFAIMAWNGNGFPLITTMDDEYIHYAKLDNLAVNQSLDTTINLEMDEVGKYVQIYCIEYTDFDGNVWENPYMNDIENNAGIKIENVQGAYFEFED